MGEVFLTHDYGWACSNQAELEVEKDFDEERKVNVKTTTLKVYGIFNAIGEIYKDLIVCLVYKNEEGKLLGFNGIVKGITERKATIKLTTKHDRIKEILQKIKEETKNGR